MELLKKINQLKDIPLFKNMEPEDIGAALQCVGAFLKTYKKGAYVLLEEDKVQSVGCVLSGNVEMIREDIWGNKTVLVSMGEKELFGESFVCGSTMTASVSFVAKESTEVLFLPFERVMHSCSSACAHHQHLLLNMVTLIAEKNVAFITKIDIMSKKTLREKIGAYLLVQADLNKSRYFTIPLGRVELAEYLNADRSALTRELNSMKKEGLIDFDKNTFRIIKSFF